MKCLPLSCRAQPIATMDAKTYRLQLFAGLAMVLAVCGVLLATVVSPNLEASFNSMLSSNFVITSPSSSGYSAWTNSSDPNAPVITASFVVYDIKNGEDVVQRGSKPLVSEISSPSLSYSLNSLKLDVDFESATGGDGDIVSYKLYQWFTPLSQQQQQQQTQEQESPSSAGKHGGGGPVVTTLNVPLLTLLNNPLTAMILAASPYLNSRWFSNSSALFVQRSAEEVLFGWHDDAVFVDFNRYKPGWFPSVPTTYQGVQANDSSPEEAQKRKSITRMHTGAQSPQQMMQLQAWGGTEELRCCFYGPCGNSGTGDFVGSPWMTDDANSIGGSVGLQFQLGIDCDDKLRVGLYDQGILRHFDLSCGVVDDSSPVHHNGGGGGSNGTASAGVHSASGKAHYDGQGDVDDNDDDDPFTYSVQGINLLRFTLPRNVLDNATSNPLDGVVYTQFGPDGLLNQTRCEGGAPIFLSKPRFLDGDISLVEALNGLSEPNRVDHDSWLGVEANTGSTLDFHFRVATNAYVRPFTVPLFTSSGTAKTAKTARRTARESIQERIWRFYAAESGNGNGNGTQYITALPNVTAVFLPIAWLSQDSVVTADQASAFRSDVYTPLVVIKSVFWGGVAFASLAGAAALVLMGTAVCRRRSLQAKIRAGLADKSGNPIEAAGARANGGKRQSSSANLGLSGINNSDFDVGVGGGAYAPLPSLSPSAAISMPLPRGLSRGYSRMNNTVNGETTLLYSSGGGGGSGNANAGGGEVDATTLLAVASGGSGGASGGVASGGGVQGIASYSPGGTRPATMSRLNKMREPLLYTGTTTTNDGLLVSGLPGNAASLPRSMSSLGRSPRMTGTNAANTPAGVIGGGSNNNASTAASVAAGSTAFVATSYGSLGKSGIGPAALPPSSAAGLPNALAGSLRRGTSGIGFLATTTTVIDGGGGARGDEQQVVALVPDGAGAHGGDLTEAGDDNGGNGERMALLSSSSAGAGVEGDGGDSAAGGVGEEEGDEDGFYHHPHQHPHQHHHHHQHHHLEEEADEHDHGHGHEHDDDNDSDLFILPSGGEEALWREYKGALQQAFGAGGRSDSANEGGSHYYGGGGVGGGNDNESDGGQRSISVGSRQTAPIPLSAILGSAAAGEPHER